MTFPIALAMRTALRSPHPHYRHCALLFRGGALVAIGYNHNGRHAEHVALSKLWPSKRRGLTLVSLRVNRSGSFSNARPCKSCSSRIKAAGVSRVYHSISSGEIILA